MASNWLSIDNNMPTITGKETTWQLIMQLHNFIPILVESLKYQLSNLEASNWNQKAMKNFQKDTTKEVEDAVDSTDKELLALTADLEKLDERLRNLAARVTETETDLAQVMGWKNDLEQLVQGLEEQVGQAQTALDELGQAITIGEDGSITIGAAGVNLKLVGNVTVNGSAV